MSRKYMDQFLQEIHGAAQEQKSSTIKLDPETLKFVQHWKREAPTTSVRELACWLIKLGHEAALEAQQAAEQGS